MAYVPLIAPSTTTHRIRFLASIADTFIYVVSKVILVQNDIGNLSDFDTDGYDRIFRQGGREFTTP
jgi:hypothetical protein